MPTRSGPGFQRSDGQAGELVGAMAFLSGVDSRYVLGAEIDGGFAEI